MKTKSRKLRNWCAAPWQPQGSSSSHETWSFGSWHKQTTTQASYNFIARAFWDTCSRGWHGHDTLQGHATSSRTRTSSRSTQVENFAMRSAPNSVSHYNLTHPMRWLPPPWRGPLWRALTSTQTD